MTKIESDNSNNGLLTKIWGPPLWEFIHSMTFGYPKKPSDEQKKRYKEFILSLGHVLPCGWCRNSYNEFIKKGTGALVIDKDLENRDTLIRWGFRIHNRVNEKLGVDYGVTLDDLYAKYENYRAKCVVADKGCTMPIALKGQSYEWANVKHAPIVPRRFSMMFANYALMRNMKYYKDRVRKNDMALNSAERSDRRTRDAECVKIIEYMRLRAIDCTESEGPYEGLPTECELALLSRRCSTMSKTKQEAMAKRLKKFYDDRSSTDNTASVYNEPVITDLSVTVSSSDVSPLTDS